MSVKAPIAIDTSPFFDGPKDSFHSFNHLYHVTCVVHGLSACGACFLGFYEKDSALAKSTFDSRVPQIKGGSGRVAVVRTCVVLEGGLTESRTFV
jgi:hypothetical protein